MVERRQGLIVNTSSGVAVRYTFNVQFGVQKAGVEICYGLIETNAPARRIVAIRAGERGYYVTDFDSETLKDAEAL
nr:hypothetical protein [Variovorax paradoxus]